MSNLKKRFWQFVERMGHERVRLSLLGMSDRQLTDAGFSRELLLMGSKAWPWRAPQDDWQQRFKFDSASTLETVSTRESAKNISEADVQLAIEELDAYSDQELNDLGLTRGTIEYAVRYGRSDDNAQQRLMA